jgi:hypothetical protein
VYVRLANLSRPAYTEALAPQELTPALVAIMAELIRGPSQVAAAGEHNFVCVPLSLLHNPPV